MFRGVYQTFMLNKAASAGGTLLFTMSAFPVVAAVSDL